MDTTTTMNDDLDVGPWTGGRGRQSLAAERTPSPPTLRHSRWPTLRAGPCCRSRAGRPQRQAWRRLVAFVRRRGSSRPPSSPQPAAVTPALGLRAAQGGHEDSASVTVRRTGFETSASSSTRSSGSRRAARRSIHSLPRVRRGDQTGPILHQRDSEPARPGPSRHQRPRTLSHGAGRPQRRCTWSPAGWTPKAPARDAGPCGGSPH